MNHKKYLLLVCLMTSATLLAWAQTRSDKLTIPRIDKPPTLADFAGMEASKWVAASMASVSGFVQREPADGAPATQDTTAYIAYDKKNLYVVFLAWDSEPKKIRARMSPREKVFDDDYVDIQLDTFHDRRRAYTFLATPLGIQWDALWTEGKDFDDSFQALWYSEGKITDRGYMVLMTIPFSSLRFSPETEQTWGILFNRTIPRLSEESFWPEYTNRIEGRLNQAATMEGITSVSPGRNIQLNPYAFARNLRVLNREEARFEKDDFDPDGGLDAKIVIRDSFVLDLTANPDFSQVESDEPQVTVNQRFEVRFPERRPFFLENADFFQTFTPLVFTRRIVDPRYGIRFTGKSSGWSIGSMLIDDEAPGRGRAPDDPLAGESAEVGILRLNRDITGQSTVGFLYTDRSFEGDENRVIAVDGRFKLNPNWTAEAQVAHAESDRAGSNRSGTSINAMVNRSGRHLNMHNHFLRTEPGFRTRLGFLSGEQRPDSINFHNHSSYTFWPENSKLISWEIAARVGRLWDIDRDALDTFIDPQISWEWRGDRELELEFHRNRQRLRPQDYAQLAADLELTESIWELSYNSEFHAKFSVSVEIGGGQGINFVPLPDRPPAEGDQEQAELNLTWRPLPPLRLDIDYFYVSLHEDNGDALVFRNEIARLRANWQFTRELSLRVIGQFEETNPNPDRTFLTFQRGLNTDLLIRYVLNPWSSAYLGYNSNRSNFEIVETENGSVVVPTTGALNGDGEQFFFKLSYLFQF